jgi:hypothetical protein
VAAKTGKTTRDTSTAAAAAAKARAAAEAAKVQPKPKKQTARQLAKQEARKRNQAHNALVAAGVSEPQSGALPPMTDERLAMAKMLGKLGATDLQVSQAFDVTPRTIYLWKLSHPEFKAALDEGKAMADEMVVESLFKRCTGYTFDTEKVMVVEGRIERVQTTEHVPPDAGAALKWLRLRRQEWREEKPQETEVNPIAQFLETLGGTAFTPVENPDETSLGGTTFMPVMDEDAG